MTALRTFVASMLVLGLLAGCDLEPEVGGLSTNRCDNADTDTGTQVSFINDIWPILVDRCNRCHDPSNPDAFGAENSGLDLSSYDALRSGGGNTGGGIVVVEQPCGSLLYQKLLPGPPIGSRMPLGGPPLSPFELDQVHDWIAEGALNN